MASSSTSSIHKSFKYDVFLSFRGEDTRKNFVDHLYYALQQKRIHTYKDDERIEKGVRISDQLMRSIEDSRFHVIIFSKNFAFSSWCLEKLVTIMECQKTHEQTAYPAFYDVESSEVRKQIGEFGKVYAEHNEKKAAAGKWRKALEEAANLGGWELKNTADGSVNPTHILIEFLDLHFCPQRSEQEIRFFTEIVTWSETFVHEATYKGRTKFA
ncbi:toll/interleukin-1 receptor-like protein [Cynara cardunculus var. scolymus]|uniref:toll/interleukin-1 receptor-like protein n=1 Tax=Cynara cardunculus var. scolymus TaxID=59895 RepID=UPI000D62BC96|nr:toll/interleukin-1 receptor-like protein [Cynara cardunculus var. scolymus]